MVVDATGDDDDKMRRPEKSREPPEEVKAGDSELSTSEPRARKRSAHLMRS